MSKREEGKDRAGVVSLDCLNPTVILDLSRQARKLARVKYPERRADQSNEYDQTIEDAKWSPPSARYGLTELCLIDPTIPWQTLVKGVKDAGFLSYINCEVAFRLGSAAAKPYVIQYQDGSKYRGRFNSGKAKPCLSNEEPLDLHEAMTVLVAKGKEQLLICEMVVICGFSDKDETEYARLSLNESRADWLGIFPATNCKGNYKVGLPTKSICS